MPSGLSRLTKIKLTEADCSNVTWTFKGYDDGYRVSIGHGTHPVTGMEMTVERREPMIEDDLIRLNTEERLSRDGKRWGSGAGSEKGGNMPMVRVGRIPMNKFLTDAADKMREGDKDHLKWLLNSEAYQPFRTKSGRL
jgi:hypothetical protein